MTEGGGSPILTRTVEYHFVLADNVVPVALKSKDATDEFGGAADRSAKAVDRQSISYIRSVASMGAFRHGLRSITTGLEELGVVNRKTNKTFFEMVSIVDVLVGFMLMFKGIIGIMNLLAKAEWGVAIIETYRKILQNPAWAAVAVGAGVAAGAIGGYLYSEWTRQSPESAGGSTQTINQNIWFTGGPDYSARSAARASMEGVY